MKQIVLDEIDWKILTNLQENGRMTNVELAQNIGLSAPPCLRRVQSLERTGFIKGYHADIDIIRLGFTITVFAMVGLHNQAEKDLQAFEVLVQSWPQIRECYMLNGDIDFILKCVDTDLSSFQKFLTGQLTCAPNVAHVRTSMTIRQTKHLHGVDETLRKT